MHPLVQEQLEQLLAFQVQNLADHELHAASLEHHLAEDRRLIERCQALINATRFELAGGQPVEASSHGSLGLGKALGSIFGGVNVEPDDDGQRDGFDSEGSVPEAPVITGLSFGNEAPLYPPADQWPADSQFAGIPDTDLFDDEGGCAACHVRPGMLHLDGCAVADRLRGGA